jgi:hypothetical protein
MLQRCKNRIHIYFLKYRSWATPILYAFAAYLIFLGYYYYLNYLYVLDGPYDLHGPQELTLSEKMTIYVSAPKDISDLKAFVLHYSVCPVVHDINIAWHDSQNDPPKNNFFPFTTTHSLVSYRNLNSNPASIFETYFDASKVRTEGIFLLDADILVSCEDLSFAQSVWRSSTVTSVGYYPRLLTPASQNNVNSNLIKYTYTSASTVFWKQSYSMLLGSAILVKKSILQVNTVSVIINFSIAKVDF